jgi:uncharacterized FlaG/YvyC family protein
MDSLKTSSISPQVVSSATGAGAAVADAQAVKRVIDGSTERPPEQGSESSRASETMVARILGARDSSQDSLKVSIDKNDGVIVKIVDSRGNTVRQIPPEELIALARRMGEMIGLLFDKTA